MSTALKDTRGNEAEENSDEWLEPVVEARSRGRGVELRGADHCLGDVERQICRSLSFCFRRAEGSQRMERGGSVLLHISSSNSLILSMGSVSGASVRPSTGS